MSERATQTVYPRKGTTIYTGGSSHGYSHGAAVAIEKEHADLILAAEAADTEPPAKAPETAGAGEAAPAA